MPSEIDFEVVEETLDSNEKNDKETRVCHTCGYPLELDETAVCAVCQDNEREDWE